MRGEAEAIVTGDRHLLRLKAWEGFRIVKATTLLDELGIEA
jgi:predicted nucleic acid-binding protein